MLCVNFAFTYGKLSCKPVYNWIDCFGRMWLAENCWGWDRQQTGREYELVQIIRKERLYEQSQES